MKNFWKFLICSMLASAPPLQATLVSYTFTDAPEISTARANDPANNPANAPNRASAPTTLASGLTASDFQIVAATGLNQIIATAADDSFGAAQISGFNNGSFIYDGTLPYFEFTVNGIETLEELRISARGGYEWRESDGDLVSQPNRNSAYVVRWSVDSFGSDLHTPIVTTNNTGVFTTGTVDLSLLDFMDNSSITFRIFTKYATTSNTFNRTQINSVELTGVAIPEPSTLAMIGVAGIALALGLRRRKK